jgi:hypothetical protein
MAALATTNLHRPKLLNLTLLCTLSMTINAIRVLVRTREGISCVALMVKADLRVHLLPTKGVMTLLALIELDHHPSAMKLTMARDTLFRGV